MLISSIVFLLSSARLIDLWKVWLALASKKGPTVRRSIAITAPIHWNKTLLLSRVDKGVLERAINPDSVRSRHVSSRKLLMTAMIEI